MRRADVLGDDLLPPSPTQPAAEEALHFLDLANLVRVVVDAETSLRREAPLLLHRSQVLWTESEVTSLARRDEMCGAFFRLTELCPVFDAVVLIGYSTCLRSQLLDFNGELLALLSVLPSGGLLAFDDLNQMKMLLLEFLLLQKHLAEAERRGSASSRTKYHVRIDADLEADIISCFNIQLPCVLDGVDPSVAFGFIFRFELVLL